MLDTVEKTIVAWLEQYFNYECLHMLDTVELLLHGWNNTSTMTANLTYA